MKKERIDLIFICLCLVLCAVLSLGMLAAGPAQPRANERLASAPALRGQDGVNLRFLSDVSDYLSDRFFLRQELITAHNRLQAALGGGTANDVIAGADGWLYYAPTLADYTGAGALSEAELSAAARNLFLMQEYCASRGASFLFVPVPNKNSLYDAAMPDYGGRAETHSAQRLLRLLEAADVHCADLFALFRSRDDTLYFAHDSHWNTEGAALAADAINRALGRSSDYAAGDFSGRTAHAGDLFEMRYPAAADPETDAVYGGALHYVRQGSDTRPDSITINTTDGGTGALLMFRDSFGNTLYPFLADSFETARFSRATAYDLTLIDALDADCVVVELVERNLRYLLRFAPVMPAPERTLPAAQRVGGAPVVLTASAGPEGYTAWAGALPSGGGQVFLCCGETAYEAFTGGDGTFTARIPADRTPDGVCVQSEDGYIRHSVSIPLS